MVTDTVISTRALTKHFGNLCAVDAIDLNVKRGQIYGLLGRNGAGKTTTIRMLLGLIRPNSGEVTLLGTRMVSGEQAILARVGSLIETATAYPNLTVRENLDIQRRLTGSPLASVAEAIKLLRLDEYANRLAGQLSLGNKQRLALARALLHCPDVLVLDEPANALDPAGIIEIRELLRRLANDQGVTIFISSHILAEIAHIADRIAIVHSGKLIEELSLDALRGKARKHLDVAVSDPDRALLLLTERFGTLRAERTQDGNLRLFDGADRVADIARVLVSSGLDLTRLCLQEEDLESYFMRLTGGAS
jgi:ABC-2 type transport system ATP-binding protein